MAQPESKSKNTMGIDRAVDRLLSGDRVIRSHEHDQIEQQKGDKSNELMSLNLLVPTPAESEEINKFSSHSYIRVPCKARGVRGTHIARNAYIDVPINAAHGDILLCSNKACRSSGRIFRYCKVCDMPTAKRNFIKRHGHGLDVSGLLLEDGAEGDHVSSDQNNEDHSIKQFFQRKVVSSEGSRQKTLRSSAQAQSMKSNYTDYIEEQPIGKRRQLLRNDDQNDSNSTETSLKVTRSEKEGKRLLLVSESEAEWLALFRNMPVDMKENQISKMAWVSKIVAFICPEYLDLMGQAGNDHDQYQGSQQDAGSGSDDESSLSEIIGGSEGILSARYDASSPNVDNLGLEAIFENESD